MSTSINNPTSFGDDQVFDPNSTPNIQHYTLQHPATVIQPAPNIIISQPIQTVVPVTTIREPIVVGSVCTVYEAPWPTIIISMLGAVVIIYAAVAPRVDHNRRLFGVVLMLLWTLIWAIILWVLWRECHHSAAWWLLLIPVIIMAIFFILIIIMNIGSST